MRDFPLALRHAIQTHVIALVLIVMLPISAMWGWHIRTEVLKDQEQHHAKAVALSDNIVDTLTQVLEGYESLSRQLSSEYQGSPPRAVPRFNPEQFVRMHDGVLAMGVRALDGTSIYSSTRPALSSAQLSATEWGLRALHEDHFNASGAVWEPSLTRWVSVLTHPVHDKQGQSAGFVYVALDLEKLNQRVFSATPVGSVVQVLDREGRVLLRSSEPEKWIGKVVSPGGATPAKDPSDTHAVQGGASGLQVESIHTLPKSGWRVSASVAEPTVAAWTTNHIHYTIAFAALMLLAIVLLAWWRVLTIARPIRSLSQTVLRLQQDRSRRAPMEGPLELQGVAQQINSLLDQVENEFHERQALRDHYASLIGKARDIVLLFNGDGTIVDANAAAVSAYGYSLEELYTLSVVDLRPPEAQSDIARDWKSSEDAKGALFEAVHKRKDGTRFYVEVSSSRIDIDGKPFHQCFVRDIQARKLSELALHRKTRALSALHACNQVLARAPTLQSLLDEVCAVIVQGGGYMMAWVGQEDPAGTHRILPIAKAGMDEGYLAQLHVSSEDIPAGRGPSGRAMREGVTAVAHNLKTAPHYDLWRQAALAHGFAAAISLPLIAEGHAVGVLTVYAADTSAFDPAEVELLEDLASSLAGGVERFRLAVHGGQLTAQLSASEARFRMLIEQSPAGIFVLRDGGFVYNNPRMEEILGFSAGELVGKRPEELILPEDRHILSDAANRLLLLGNTGNLSVRCQRKDGVVIELGLQQVQADYEGKSAIIGMAQDISERSRAQEAIRHYIAQLEQATESTLRAVSALVEMRDPYTAGHERRVGELAGAIGTEMGLTPHQIKGLRLTGFVHDIGKIAVPAELLAKPTRLTDIEMALIRVHPQAGYDVLKDVEFPWPVAQVVLQHHERLDGSGYPNGLKEPDILLEARIMMVADVVESMTSHRPYRPGLGLDAALAEITRYSGVYYDAAVVDACKRLFLEKAYTLESTVS